MTASTDEREHAVIALREHRVAGRLTLEEFTERVGVALRGDLDAALRDLPAVARTRRRPTRFLVGFFSSTKRAGRLRLGRLVFVLVNFGNVDLDLRSAALEGDVITIFAVVHFGAFDVYVPEGVEVDLRGLSVFGHKSEHGNEHEPLPGTPLVRVYAVGTFCGIDVWRSGARGSIRQVIRAQQELER